MDWLTLFADAVSSSTEATGDLTTIAWKYGGWVGASLATLLTSATLAIRWMWGVVSKSANSGIRKLIEWGEPKVTKTYESHLAMVDTVTRNNEQMLVVVNQMKEEQSNQRALIAAIGDRNVKIDEMHEFITKAVKEREGK